MPRARLVGLVLVSSVVLGMWASNSRAQAYDIIHAFEAEPYPPFGSVIQGSDGAFYGTAGGGGNGNGIVFRINADGSGFTTVHAFAGTDGAKPIAVLQGTDSVLYGTTAEGGVSGAGVIFRVNLDGSGFMKLYDFDFANGFRLEAGLWQGTDGALYGTTAGGGAFGRGTIFKIGTDGSAFTRLHDFDIFSGESRAGLVQGTDGALYGATASGGYPFGQGQIFKINTDGTAFTELFAFEPSTGVQPLAALILGTDGAFYGTTSAGGPAGRGTVFKLNPDGTGFQTLLQFDGANGASPQGSLVQGADGVLYGTTASGGTTNNGVVFAMSADGSGFKTLLEFDGSNGGNPLSGLVLATDGLLYGTTRSAGVVFKLATDGSNFTPLHRFDWIDGAQPMAAPSLGADGVLRGTTWAGGGAIRGVIYEVNTDGSEFRKLVDFSGPNGSNSQANLIQGTDGGFYGTTYYGGSNDGGVVFRIGSDGSGFSKLLDFDFANGARPTAGLVQVADGGLLGTAANGGANGYGVVFRIGMDGSNFANLHDFQWPGDGYPIAALVQVANGTLYGTTQIGGASNQGTLFRINPDGSGFTKLHDFDGVDGASPFQLIEGNDGVIYGITLGHGSGIIFRINTDGSGFAKVLDFASTTGAQPLSLIQGLDGALYGTTYAGGAGTGVVFKVNTDGSAFTTLYEFDGVSGANPRGLVQGPDGTFYGTASSGGPKGGGVVFKLGMPAVSVQDVSVTEGDSGTVVATFTVSLTSTSSQAVAVDYTTRDDSATVGSDYVGVSGRVNFAPGEETQAVSVSINGDMLVEPDETFLLKLSSPVNAVIARSEAVGSILNDDTGPQTTVEFRRDSYAVTEGTRSASVIVTRSGELSRTVSVHYATSDGTAVAPSDYEATSGTLTFGPGVWRRVFAIPIVKDKNDERNETVNLRISDPQPAGVTVGARSTAILRILDKH